jgi:hypothetical protein
MNLDVRPAAQHFIDLVEANGGKLRVEGDRLRCERPNAAAPFMDQLNGCEAEVIRLVRSRQTGTGAAQPALSDEWRAWVREGLRRD